MLEAIYKKGGVFKYPKVFQSDNGSEFKNEVTKLLEKHNADIWRVTAKYNHAHTAFVEAFNKELAELLFKLIDGEETLKNYQRFGLKIWIKLWTKWTIKYRRWLVWIQKIPLN